MVDKNAWSDKYQAQSLYFMPACQNNKSEIILEKYFALFNGEFWSGIG